MTREPLARRAGAEALGTALLVATVVGSGIAAQRLSPSDTGLQLLENAAATALGLVVLVTLLMPVSGAHLNPAVTLVLALVEEDRRPRPRELAAYVCAQLLGGLAGAVLANLMFELPATTVSTTDRAGGGTLLGEVVAAAGLVLVVLGLVRTGRTHLAPALVAAFIGSAYWFTSSTSFANPAVTLGRTLTDTVTGIAPTSAAAFVTAQLVGALLGAALALALFPAPTARTAGVATQEELLP